MSNQWQQLIEIDPGWVSRQLNNHFYDFQDKVTLRGYTIKASGTTLSPTGVVKELYGMLIPYVQSGKLNTQQEIVAAMSLATKFFGEKNTQTDGKYGELLLFALVEAVLQCKMVAHKIRTLSNFKDQVKGGDGIFLGNYLINGNEEKAYLIGESKIMGDYNSAISDALLSIDRFHDPSTAAEFYNTELIIAKDNLIIGDSVDLDELYDRLTPTTAEFREQNLIHPILLMYNSKNINEFEVKANNNQELESFIKDEFIKRKDTVKRSILKKVQTYPNIKKVYLDFFLLPFNDVDSFRNAMYYEIHGVPFKK